MRAEIRHLHTPDFEPPGNFVPEDPERFTFFVQMFAGPLGEEGEESFGFVVCTPGWLEEQAKQGPVNGRHYVIVNNFHWPTLESYFQRLATRIWGETWSEVADKLSRYGHWEFEDYTP